MATRSWWRWGTEEASVRGAEAAELERRVRALLPEGDLTVHAPPAIADLDVPAPRITVPAALAPITATDPPARLSHARGRPSATWCATCAVRSDRCPRRC